MLRLAVLVCSLGACLLPSACVALESGSRIQLRSNANARYVCVDPLSYVLTANPQLGWLHGCTFEVSALSEGRFALKAMKTGGWLHVEQGLVMVNATSASTTFEITGPANDTRISAADGRYWALTRLNAAAPVRVGGSQWDTFSIVEVPFIRGVNLGSLFIPEAWMIPSYYANTTASDLCTISRLNHTAAKQRMKQHLDSYITEADIAWLRDNGFNSVRLPLGYWNVIGNAHAEPHYAYPGTVEQSLALVDRIFDWTQARGISVLLDLHGAPGGQNGQDNSGCANLLGWLNHSSNVELSLAAIDALASRYGARENLYGIEVLNEPAFDYELDKHKKLLAYYAKAYAAVRAHSATAVVAFSELWTKEDYSLFGLAWENQLVEPEYYNVAMDIHKYDCFGNDSSKTLQQHLKAARAWGGMIDSFQGSNGTYVGHPVFVGEWSLATGSSPNGQAYATAQTTSFRHGFGYYFWSLKMENADKTWSLYDLVASGVQI